jgi:amino acid permease
MRTRGQHRLHATLALVGTIIGAGVFGVPAMIGEWGVIPATIGFWVIALAVLATHLLYAEAILRHRVKARLSGHAGYFLGPIGAVAGGFSETLQIFGSNLAYIILGGGFLTILAGSVGIHAPVLFWQVLFSLGGIATVLSGLGWVSRIGAFFTWSLVSVMLLIIGISLGKLDLGLITFIPSHVGIEPYGVFLFALFGLNAVPEMVELVDGRRDDLMKSVVRASLSAAALIYLFGVSAWLASSGTLGREPTDLIRILPAGVALLIPLFGFLAVSTPYLMTAYELGSMFRLDFHLPSPIAWAVALGVPITLLFMTSRDFLGTIGLVGSVFGAGSAIVAVQSGRIALVRSGASRPGSRLWKWRHVVPRLLIGFYVLGGLSWLFL